MKFRIKSYKSYYSSFSAFCLEARVNIFYHIFMTIIVVCFLSNIKIHVERRVTMPRNGAKLKFFKLNSIKMYNTQFISIHVNCFQTKF